MVLHVWQTGYYVLSLIIFCVFVSTLGDFRIKYHENEVQFPHDSRAVGSSLYAQVLQFS